MSLNVQRCFKVSFFALYCFLLAVGCATNRTLIEENSIDGREGGGSFSVIQGVTTEDSAVVHIHSLNGVLPGVSVTPSQGVVIEQSVIRPESIGLNQKASTPNAVGSIFRIHLSNLQPQTVYQLKLSGLERSELNYELSSLSFKTFDDEWSFAVLSCLSDEFVNQSEAMTQALVAVKPKMLFLIGDNVYADVERGRLIHQVTPEVIWNRHMQSLTQSSLFQQRRLVPVFAVWDDHDYGVNDGDSSFKWKSESLRVHKAFWPTLQDRSKMPNSISKKIRAEAEHKRRIPQISWTPGYGAGSVLKIQEPIRNQFVFLDNRSFRSSKVESGLKSSTHFGQEQLLWLEKQVAQFDGFSWLISGDQWFGGYHRFESYERNAPYELEHLMKALSQTRRSFAFLSGDRHLSEIMKVNESDLSLSTYEFTSSGFYARTYPGRWNESPNPRQIRASELDFNFTVFQFAKPKGDSQNSQIYTLKAEARGLDSKILYRIEGDVAPFIGR